MAELVDAHDSKSCEAIRAGSTPAVGTIEFKSSQIQLHQDLRAFFFMSQRIRSPKQGYGVALCLLLYKDDGIKKAHPVGKRDEQKPLRFS